MMSNFFKKHRERKKRLEDLEEFCASIQDMCAHSLRHDDLVSSYYMFNNISMRITICPVRNYKESDNVVRMCEKSR